MSDPAGSPTPREQIDLQAHGTADALRLLIESLDRYKLPDDYEVKITAGFARNLAALLSEREAARAVIEAARHYCDDTADGREAHFAYDALQAALACWGSSQAGEPG